MTHELREYIYASSTHGTLPIKFNLKSNLYIYVCVLVLNVGFVSFSRCYFNAGDLKERTPFSQKKKEDNISLSKFGNHENLVNSRLKSIKFSSILGLNLLIFIGIYDSFFMLL